MKVRSEVLCYFLLLAAASNTQAFQVPTRTLSRPLTPLPPPQQQRAPRSIPLSSQTENEQDTAVNGSSSSSSSTTTTNNTVDGNNQNPWSQLFTPRPPSTPPPSYSYQELLEESDASAQQVEELQVQLGTLRAQLALKEEALLTKQKEWNEERNSLVDTITDFSNMLETVSETSNEDAERTKQLEKEVELLQNQLPVVQNMLKTEQLRAEELRDRLHEVEDTLEYQQMEFEKEKKQLSEILQKEKDKLAKIQKSWDQEKERFQKDRDSIYGKLQQETTKLEQTQRELETNQKAYEEECEALVKQLEQQREKMVKNYVTYQTVGNADKLQEELERDRQNLMEIKDYLTDAAVLYERMEQELRRQILDEQSTVAQLNSQLELQQENFEREKADLEERIAQEQRIIQELEEQLAAERFEFAREKVKLQFDLEEEVRIRKLKMKQMKRRFDQIRKEMTALWEGAKRDARREKKMLMAKYDAQITEMTNLNKQLEGDMSSVRKRNVELETMLTEVTIQRDNAQREVIETERRYMGMLSERNRRIEALKTDVAGLRVEIDKKTEQLELIQNSYRQQLKLSVQLTGKRIKKMGSRVKGVFRNKEINDK